MMGQLLHYAFFVLSMTSIIYIVVLVIMVCREEERAKGLGTDMARILEKHEHARRRDKEGR